MVTMKSTLERITKPLIIITFTITVGLYFFATPYVFSGALMKPAWDHVRLIFFSILLLEVAVLNIRSFSIRQRILIWAFIVILITSRILGSMRVTTNLFIVYVIVSAVILSIDNKNKTFPLNRLSMMTITGLFFVFSVILDIQLFDKNAFLLSGLLTGFIFGLLTFIISLVMLSQQKKYTGYKLEFRLAILFFSPLVFFLLFNTINYSLDTSQPTTHELIILDLDVDTGFRDITQFKVYFNMDGKTYHVGVSQTDFYGYQIGDTIEIKIYKGFLNEPYMLYE